MCTSGVAIVMRRIFHGQSGTLKYFSNRLKIHSKKHFNVRVIMKFGEFDIISLPILSADKCITKSISKGQIGIREKILQKYDF